LNYEVQETPLFSELSGSVPSIGQNKRLVKFSFEISLNTVSEPFKGPAGYAVVKITEVAAERFRPFEELKEQLKPAVLREKKFEKINKTKKIITFKIMMLKLDIPLLNSSSSSFETSLSAIFPNSVYPPIFITTAKAVPETILVPPKTIFLHEVKSLLSIPDII
jgi:hypothetical protein